MAKGACRGGATRWGVLALVALTLLPVLSRTVQAVARLPETSVVQLFINERVYSEEFELLDQGETVLLPLLATARILDAEVQLDPKTLSATVTRTWDGKTARVDLAAQSVTLEATTSALSPPGEALSGDYYLPVDAAELLFDVQVKWDPEIQAAQFLVSRTLKALRAEEAARPVDGRSTASEEESALPSNRFPVFSLGSIQYVISNSQTTDENRWASKDELELDAHLQAGGIPIDVSGRIDRLTKGDREWSLEEATATYLSPKLEVVLGDTTLNVGRVIQNANLRGLRYSAPPGWSSGLLQALTTIEGWVVPGSTVQLVINGYFLGTTTAEDGHYLFKNVPLQITRGNFVELTITEPDGTLKRETRTIAAIPRLLEKGQVESAAGWGWVRQEGSAADWSAVMSGAAAYTGLTPWLTIGGEVARRRGLAEGANDSLAGNLGLAFRASDGLIFSLDWMSSRPTDGSEEVAQGADLTANLQLGPTSWQTTVFYREKELRLFSPIYSDVKGYRIIGETQLSKAWDLQAGYERTQSVSDPSREPASNLALAARWASGTGDSAVLKLTRQERELDAAEFTYRHTSPRTAFGLELGGEWDRQEPDPQGLREAKAKADLRQVLGSTVIASLSRTEQYFGTTEEYVRASTTEAELAWFPGKSRVALTGTLKDTRWRDEAPVEPYTQTTYALDLSRTVGAVTAGVLAGVRQDFQPELTDRVVLESAYVTARQAPTGLVGQLRVDYERPVLGEYYPERLAAVLRAGYLFRNGFYFGLEGQSERKAPADKTEYYVGLTMSQGLGFSNGGVRGFRATDGRPLGYVEGVVYLDANRNGQRDQGEKGMPGIPVFLAGRRTKTDRDGRYCFEFVNPGIYLVGLDPDTLPADYTPTGEPQLIKLNPNTNCSGNFGVALNGTVDGTVFLDYDHDGKPGKNEPRYPWVRVLLDGKIEAFTDNRGRFSFADVNLGKHVLSVDPESLPDETAAPDPVEVEITEENVDVWDVALPLESTSAR